MKGLLVAFVALLLIACGGDQQQGEGNDGLSKDSSRAVPVETRVITSGKIVEKVRATGTVVARHDVLVSSETAGTITHVFVEVGDRVRKGETLVQVDEELKRLALQQAEARLAEARAAYEKALKDFERNKKLYENENISEYIFENARLQKESAHAAYLSADASVKMARRQLRDARIVSPVNGFVAARLVDLGHSVAPGTPVARVVDIGQVKVRLGVSEEDVVKIQKGQKATVAVDAYPTRTFSGRVSAVGPQADLSTRTFPVEILIDNRDNALKAGMVAKVEIATGIVEDVPLLPKSALLERAGQTLIFVVKDHVAYQRTPALGRESGEFIALLKGASVGEEVVVFGQENLVDGARVQTMKRPQE